MTFKWMHKEPVLRHTAPSLSVHFLFGKLCLIYLRRLYYYLLHGFLKCATFLFNLNVIYSTETWFFPGFPFFYDKNIMISILLHV